MADSKRQDSAKGAIVKVGPQGPGNLEAMSKIVGARIRMMTNLANHTIEGTLYTTCSTTSLIAVRESDKSSTVSAPTFRIMDPANIKEYTILELPTNEGKAEPSVSVDKEELKKREAAAVKKAKTHEASRGKDVSPEAQALYDHIARTLPCRWNEKDIIVSDSVIIKPPYKSDNCKAPQENKRSMALPQIRKVVDGFWAKRPSSGSSSGTGRAPPATPVIRKGG